MLSQVSRNKNSYLLGSATVNQESVLGNILSLLYYGHQSQTFTSLFLQALSSFFIIIKKTEEVNMEKKFQHLHCHPR